MTARTHTKHLSSALGLKAFVLVVCLAIVGLEGWRDWSERRQEFAKVASETLNLAKSLTQHAEDSFELADALLVDVVDRVERDGTQPAAIAEMDEVLTQRVQTLQRIKSLTVYGEDGYLLTSSLPGHRHKVNIDGEEFFKHHRSSTSSLWFFGPLIRDPLGSDWVLTISRRIDKADGSFGGVAVASIPPRYFANFFSRFDTGSRGSIVLFHRDGTLLSRYPYTERAIGVSGAYEPWFQPGQTSGTFEYVSPIDGVTRIGGFQRNHIFPFGILAAVGRDDAIAKWNQLFVFRTLAVMMLVGTIASLGWGLSGELRRREMAEAELAILANTDGLTGLANRRTFDLRFNVEWLRSSRDGTPLSLLLIDVDHFKAYNDIYGHLAGDECLQAVANVLAKSVDRPGDLVARYGGEEIAVLLPETETTEALSIAERIRRQVEELGVPHAANPAAGVLTVSIGGATRVSGSDTSYRTPKDLITLADQALYRAKLEGRNRVATVETI